jgi:hypothetical protein
MRRRSAKKASPKRKSPMKASKRYRKQKGGYDAEDAEQELRAHDDRFEDLEERVDSLEYQVGELAGEVGRF